MNIPENILTIQEEPTSPFKNNKYDKYELITIVKGQGLLVGVRFCMVG